MTSETPTTRPGTLIGEVRANDDGSVRLTVFTPTGCTVVREEELERLRAEVAAYKDAATARDRNEDALRAEVEALRDKAIRFDLDAIGIASRERSDVELVELRAEVAALRPDARRYRWLRERDAWTTAYGGVNWALLLRQAPVTEGLPLILANYGTHLDAAIDAAMAKEQGRG